MNKNQKSLILKYFLLLLGFFVSSDVSAILYQSQNLEMFSITTATKNQLFSATSDEQAYISGHSSVLTSKKVNIELKKKNANMKWTVMFRHRCDSFTLDLEDLFLTCELEQSKKIMTYNFNRSKIIYFDQ